MTLPAAPALPDHLVPHYAKFLESLHRNHGLNITQATYFRLCLDAPQAEVVKLNHAQAATVLLLIQSRPVCCLYEITTGVLSHTFPGRQAYPTKSRATFQAEHRNDSGTRRKLKMPRQYARHGKHRGEE